MKKTAIIIVNWNGKQFLRDCLTAVFRQTYKNFDVYFVDNGSTDHSLEYVHEYFPLVKCVSLSTNTGFAKGNNEGIKKAFKDQEVQYIVCLNNDTIVSEHWLEELVTTAETGEDVGAVSSKAYFEGGTIIQNAGLIFSKALQINQKGGVSLGFGKTDSEVPELSKDIEIFAPGGVAALYKRGVLEILLQRDGEIFDEDFFAYVEDWDLGFRIGDLGYRSFLSAKATLIHLHSKTGGASSPFKAYYCERNAALSAIKNLPLIDLILFPLRNMALKFSYLFKKNNSVQTLQKNVGVISMLWILMKANISALVLAPKFLRKRSSVRRKNRVQ